MTASVVIVGGGVMGASAAYHLAARGWRDILVLDRAPRPGLGSTGRATGGFRAQFSTAVNVRLSILAREKLLRFKDETGADPGYLPAGYLWLATGPAELAALRAALAVQRAEGLSEAREVSVEDIGALNPAVRLEGIVGGTFCPTDGYLSPLSILEGYLEAARRLGARVEWDTEVLGFERDAGGRLARVLTSRGAFAAGAVINASGAWAGTVARFAGAPIPVTPLRRQAAATVPCQLLPSDMPMTIFAGDGFHLRVRDGRVLLLRPSPGKPGQAFDDSVDPDWVSAVATIARQRVPVLEQAVIDPAGCWAGLYEMSPDHHAILGASPECPNLFCINGSSGHGVMHAPALGQLLAEIMTDGAASTMDASALAPSRFAARSTLPSGDIL